MCKISVIVPTYNRIGRLKQVLASLECQSVPLEEYEVVVVSDGSTDDTAEYLNSLETPLQLKRIFQDNAGPAVARNNGVAHAVGDLVLFVDDDVVPTAELLAEHLRSHEESVDHLVVLGPMLTPADFQMSAWVRWEQAKLVEQYHAMQHGHWAPTARQFYTGNSSLSRAEVVAAGGFDARFRRAEDVDLGYRLAERGVKFVFNENAVGYHYAERSFRSWLATPYQYGFNDVVFSLEKGQRWLIRTVVHEFRKRRALTRWLVLLCLDHRLPATVAVGMLRVGAEVANLMGLEAFSQGAYSGIFNLRYYQGIADGLGGRERFLAQFS